MVIYFVNHFVSTEGGWLCIPISSESPPSLRNWLEPGVKKESRTYFISVDLAVLWACFPLEKTENEGMGIRLAWAFQPIHFFYK